VPLVEQELLSFLIMFTPEAPEFTLKYYMGVIKYPEQFCAYLGVILLPGRIESDLR
jgi:hypothetical protein